MNPLAQLKCQVLDGGQPMGPGDIAAHLRELPDWSLVDGAIEKTFRFANYHQTIAFVNALAWVAHGEDHHPDLQVSYASCRVRFNTHSVGGISLNDFICAAKADALVG
jgi:4a-hydroxytetrahydrobiopterin dehydratase